MTGVLAVILLLAGDAPVSTEQNPWLRPGEYRLRITATEGPQDGQSVEGAVVLRQTRSDDRSPSGQEAKDRDIRRHPLFGWTDIPLEDVGAPMSSDGPEPRPTSTDPVYPGILVDTGWKAKEPKGRPSDAPLLWIGSVANRRDGSSWTDGGGVVLFVKKRKGPCLTGTWEEAGIIRIGRGTFRLCPK